MVSILLRMFPNAFIEISLHMMVGGNATKHNMHSQTESKQNKESEKQKRNAVLGDVVDHQQHDYSLL